MRFSCKSIIVTFLLVQFCCLSTSPSTSLTNYFSSEASSFKLLSSSHRNDFGCSGLCPNGENNPLCGEKCDDGNGNSGDGCNNCQVESGWDCTTPYQQISVCTRRCGNGSNDSGEECDDSNGSDGDGCDQNCNIESGYTCSGWPSTCVANPCSNGTIDSGEQCDDNNGTDGDGCSSSCQIEPGYECSGTPSSCNLICSNSVIDSGEQCDDGDATSGDGCNSTCQIESGYECNGTPSSCNLICSNSAIDSGEQCDDGGVAAGDGCDASCQIESGYECNGTPSSCNLICSNSVIDSGEQCDDGDATSGDGCNSACQIESGYECNGTPSSCNLICSNSAIDSGEQCDDGGVTAGDGCDASCQIESGYECSGTPSVCNLICSNGVIDTGEQCDDNGVTPGDGCSATCQIESGYECNGTPSSCNLICSNSVIDSGETCDDGGVTSSDGCDATCQIESGWECSGAPSACNLICSNSRIDSGEQCDDGGSSGGDGCDSTCQIESGWECSGAPSSCNLICSNGRIDSGEQCDDGNLINGDGCDSTCNIEGGWECPTSNPSSCNLICSNSRIDGSETCDDGNLINGDGCDNTCQIETLYECPISNPSVCNLICSNSEHNSPEECDDGNTVDNDGCDSNCKIEEGWVCSSYPSQCSFCGDGITEVLETCDDGNTLQDDGCDEVCSTEQYYQCTGQPSICKISKIEATAGVQQIGNSVSSSLNAGMSLQLVIAVVLGQSLSSMWILINTLQIIHYSAMMTLYFPKIMVTLFSFLGVANLENKMFSKLYLLHFDSSQVEDRASWDYRFENQNVESTNVLLNCADMFFALILLVLYNIFIMTLACILGRWWPSGTKLKKDAKVCTKLMTFISKRISVMQEDFFFNSVYRIAFELFLDICFASLYSIYNMKWDNYIDYYSNIVSFIWACIFSSVLISIPFVYFWMPKNYDKDSGRFKVFFEDFKHNHKVYMLDHFIFLLRRLVLILVLIFRWNHGIQQAGIFLFACFIVIIWKILVRPFKDVILNFQDIVFEFLLALVILMYFKFTNSEDELTSSGINHIVGLVLCTIVLIMILINFGVTVKIYIHKLCFKKSKGKINIKKTMTRIRKKTIPELNLREAYKRKDNQQPTSPIKNPNISTTTPQKSTTSTTNLALSPSKFYSRCRSPTSHAHMSKYKSAIIGRANRPGGAKLHIAAVKYADVRFDNSAS
ncbi:unnamed protein product [Moneuplotes crassus]|uniref:DUF4215 domain-containing protein n=1 Tax=Euplotes crassus TaxID=5936 RepID=A0AAD1XEW4_EUPCR|nr:unnamed protein product [Moneuplotes crassus]